MRLILFITGSALLDILNPIQSRQSAKESSSDTNPLGLPNLFGGLNILNGTKNPLQSALSGDEAKLFFVATQGLVIPVSEFKNGLTDLLPNIQGLPKLPFVP